MAEDEIVYFSDFAERRCPWFRMDYSANNGYGCAHPAQEELEIIPVPAAGGNFDNDGVYEHGPKCLVPEGKCYSFSCPLGYEIHPDSEPADRRLLREHGLRPRDFSDSSDAFLLLDGVLPPSEASEQTGRRAGCRGDGRMTSVSQR